MTLKLDTNKKTILQVVPALVSGGVERGTLEIAKTVAASGYNSLVISAGGPLVKHMIEDGSHHILMNVASKNPFIMWRNAKKIADIIKKYKVDIVHARSRAPAWSCYMAAKSTGAHLITTFHGVYDFSNRIKKYYNAIMTRGNDVIAVSNFVKNHILENYNADEKKITVIHRGVNCEEFDPEHLPESLISTYREKYNVPNEPNIPIILLPSRMTRWKGQMVLLEALAKLSHLDFYCIMAGDLSKHPAYVENIKNKIQSLRIQKNVQIFGPENDMLGLYGISDIVLSTSIQPEAFGRTIIEAQAMEKLVIATNIGGASETIINEKTGFHVHPDDPLDLAKKIEYCISILHSKKSQDIQKMARKNVNNKFSLKSMLKNTLKIYQKI